MRKKSFVEIEMLLSKHEKLFPFTHTLKFFKVGPDTGFFLKIKNIKAESHTFIFH